MPKFNVWFTKNIDACMSVEASSKEEAKEIALNTFASLTNEERMRREDISYQAGYFEYSYTESE